MADKCEIPNIIRKKPKLKPHSFFSSFSLGSPDALSGVVPNLSPSIKTYSRGRGNQIGKSKPGKGKKRIAILGPPTEKPTQLQYDALITETLKPSVDFSCSQDFLSGSLHEITRNYEEYLDQWLTD